MWQLFKRCIDFLIRHGDRNQNNFYRLQETGLTRKKGFLLGNTET